MLFFAYQTQAQRARQAKDDQERAQEQKLAAERLMQQEILNEEKLMQQAELNRQRTKQQKELNDLAKMQERKLYEERQAQERKLAEQRVKQARESERAVAAVKQYEAMMRIREVEAEKQKTEEALAETKAEKQKTQEALGLAEENLRKYHDQQKATQLALDRANDNLRRYEEEQRKTQQALDEAAKERAEKNELISYIDNSPPDFSLKNQLLGQVRWEAQPDRTIKFLNDWDKQNIETVEIPELKGIKFLGSSEPFSGRVRFYKEAIPQLRAAFREIRERGLLDRIVSFDGSYVARAMRGSKILSSHALGLSFDINSASNGAGREPAAPGRPGSVMELVPIFQKYGFYWGGTFKNKEGGHFEVVRIIKDLPQ